MRMLRMVVGEFRFLFKYGIIALYGVFTVLYLCLLGAIPEQARQVTSIILVFTDPAAMGLFFMGAVILLEKSQRVNWSLAVSPIKTKEYIIAKAFSFMVVGTAVGSVLYIFVGIENIPYALLGVAFSSVLFSLGGLFIAAKTNTLNGFIIAVVPFEIFLCIPALLFLFKVIKSTWWIIHPGVAAINVISGNTKEGWFSIVSLVVWTVIAFLFCMGSVKKYFQEMGGGKL